MKVAFTSCMTAPSFPEQAVWTGIAEASPEHLVLLGDSFYYDCDSSSISAIQLMTDYQFAQHAVKRVGAQFSVINFASLIGQPELQTYAIWDDHDFLWDNACGVNIAMQAQWSGYIHVSRAVFERFRYALSNKLAPGSWTGQVPVWSADTPAPGYSHHMLDLNVILHLTDGRTYRAEYGKALLGDAQLAKMTNVIESYPDHVHIIASGSVFENNTGECWLNCAAEHNRLLELASNYRLLMISGDIHDNNIAFYPYQGGQGLFEATASGAACASAVTVGALQQNWGLLDIGPQYIELATTKWGMRSSVKIDRHSWRLTH